MGKQITCSDVSLKAEQSNEVYQVYLLLIKAFSICSSIFVSCVCLCVYMSVWLSSDFFHTD